MALKRRAGRQLTQDNWDEPDEVDAGEEEDTSAPEHVLATRVIRTARRRNRDNEEKTGIFSGFSGFGKTPAPVSTAFSFISNLTNGKADSEPKLTAFNDLSKISSPPLEPSVIKPLHTIFGGTETKQDKPTPVASPPQQPKVTPVTLEAKKSNENEIPKEKNEYYINLKSLNQSVTEWINSHVEKNPYCILTPIFDDYIKYLKELDKLKPTSDNVAKVNENKITITNIQTVPAPKTVEKPIEKSPVVFKDTPIPKEKTLSSPSTSASTFTTFPITPKSTESKTISDIIKTSVGSMFSQGFSSTPVSKPPSFSFGQTKPTDTATSGFMFGSGTPFSFGSNVTPKDAPEASEAAGEENESDEPPKNTFTPVVEEDSIYSKRCKVFVKKDNVFGERGVGTLYLKPIKDSEKFQLVVRADTSLGNLLLNIVLTDSIPTQRMGKNNVMLICVPTSTAVPPPVPTLLRVKSAEEADELLEMLNKHKK